MKTYTITRVIKMSVTRKIRAESAEKADKIYFHRLPLTCNSITRLYGKNITFGDLTDDYLPEAICPEKN